MPLAAHDGRIFEQVWCDGRPVTDAHSSPSQDFNVAEPERIKSVQGVQVVGSSCVATSPCAGANVQMLNGSCVPKSSALALPPPSNFRDFLYCIQTLKSPAQPF